MSFARNATFPLLLSKDFDPTDNDSEFSYHLEQISHHIDGKIDCEREIRRHKEKIDYHKSELRNLNISRRNHERMDR